MHQRFCTRILLKEFRQMQNPYTQHLQVRLLSQYRSALRDPLPVAQPASGNTTSQLSFENSPSVHELSKEQRYILDMALSGKSLFFTGSAGTGKSFLLKQIIQAMDDKGLEVAVTASTGLAALNIGGETLHSFAGVGKGNQHANLLIKKAQHSKNIQRWRATHVLVIDEISMVEARWFDVLSDIGKILRGNPKPFGGMQLIICGDFFQLPPVPEQTYIDAGIPTRFAFQAREWDWAVPNKFRLTRVFRQHDPKFINMLEDMRTGQVSRASEILLNSLSREVKYSDGIRPVELFPLRILADSANQRQMEALPGISNVYKAHDRFAEFVNPRGRVVTPERGRLLLDKMAMSRIELKIGTQVMCTKNFREINIVNGSIGRVLDFMTPAEARRSRHFIHTIPSDDPGWDPLVYDPEALSPGREMELYRVQPGNPGSTLNELCKSRDMNFPWPTIETEGREWPVVQFDEGAVLLITPTFFTSENVMGRTEACRAQIPLILSWALTVHKAQGQTLSRVKVDLSGTFAAGQAYVGISRCKTLEGLEVLNFSPSIVFADESVVQWNKTLVTTPLSRSRLGPEAISLL
ncbi:unnamed protein product [Rhizoctonia solani]|uniref:ATP-dependent DNA helicase n=1 Tax=Rhizoctonia solani TaxID=456999 RepID=A0A8H2XUV8_9AGAM|nr:unnamed protein product [Rhizoctonia solani]